MRKLRLSGVSEDIYHQDNKRYRLVFMLFIFFVISMPLTCLSQQQGYFWYFGKKAGLDFTGFDPMPLNNSQMDTPEGAAAISDTTGKLLFYTDGVNIWNSNHEKINFRLSGDASSTQSATIVPDLSSPDQYLVFTTKSFISGSSTNYGGNYYIIKIKSGETGSVIYDYSAATGSNGLLKNSTEKFAVVPFTDTNGKPAYWFLMHEFNTNKFVKIKYDSVFRSPVYQAIGSVHKNDTIDNGTNRGAAGQMKVNDIGTRLALAVEGGKYFELFTFNTATGVISSPMLIPAGDSKDKFASKYGAYGVEFSPTGKFGYEITSGNFLYGSTIDGQVYQWDLSYFPSNDPNQFIKSGKILYTNPEMQCGGLQIAPNAKIYVAFKGQDFLGVINAPMRPDCHFAEKGARLIDNDTGLGGLCELGLPPAIPAVKEPEPFYFENLCYLDETLFYITDQNAITSPRIWSFKNLDGGNPVTKTSTTNELKYQFRDPGNYRVTLTLRRSGVAQPLVYVRDLTIHQLPVVNLASQDTVSLCKGLSLPLDAGSGAFYEWEDTGIKFRKRTITNDSLLPIMEYRVKVTDYHGCVGWDTLWVEKKIPPTATHSSIRAFCGHKDGQATVYPNGNIEDHTYQWEKYPEETSNVLSGINGGDYIVHVTKILSGCEVIDTIHVDELGGTSVKIAHQQDTVCSGVPFTLKVEGSTEFEWISPKGLSGGEVSLNIDTTTVFTVKATNRDEGRICETLTSDTIRVYAPKLFDLGADTTACDGQTISIDGGAEFVVWNWSNGQTGRIAAITKKTDSLVLNAIDRNGCVFNDHVAVSFLPSPEVNLGNDTIIYTKIPIVLKGGTGEHYLWSTRATTQTISVNKTDNYWLTITSGGCSRTDTIRVQFRDPPKLQIDSVQSRNVSCYGAADGSITVFATADLGKKMLYSIDNGVSFVDNKGLFKNLQPSNSYVVQVVEDSIPPVIWPVPIEISQPDSLDAKFCTLPPSCPTCRDGEIMVGYITGGTKPYRIEMNGMEQDSVIQGLGVGTYSLTITDSHQCTKIVKVALGQGKRPGIEASLANPVCSGTSVTLTVLNSTQVEWVDPVMGGYNLKIVVKPLVTTTYRVNSIIKDADNFPCINTLYYTIEVNTSIKPEIGEARSACEGDTISIDGGIYQDWQWSNGMQGQIIDLVKTADPLILTVTDFNGCILKDTVSVVFNKYPTVDLGKDMAICQSEPLVLEGGTGDSYLWTSDALAAAVRTHDLQITRSGKYYLEITTKGCSSSDSVNITMLDPNTFNITSVSVNDNSCFGDENGSLEIMLDDTGKAFKYSIDGGATYQSSSLFQNLPAGEYGQIRVLKDSLCYKDYLDPVVIHQPDSIHVTYRLKSPGCLSCSDGQLILDISGGTKPYRITLSGTPIELVTETLGVGSYTVLITDANLCTKTFEFSLEMGDVIPNVITPNGDGVNDLWKIPKLKYYPESVVQVFTVSGELVYQSLPGYKIPWDGKFKSNYLPSGTYYYLINLGIGEPPLTGYLTMLR